jgi:hypothetical protein
MAAIPSPAGWPPTSPVAQDPTGNLKPTRGKSSERIDEAAQRAAARHRDSLIRRGENARCNRTPTNIDECRLTARVSIEPLIVSLARCRHRCGYRLRR